MLSFKYGFLIAFGITRSTSLFRSFSSSSLIPKYLSRPFSGVVNSRRKSRSLLSGSNSSVRALPKSVRLFASYFLQIFSISGKKGSILNIKITPKSDGQNKTSATSLKSGRGFVKWRRPKQEHIHVHFSGNIPYYLLP